MELNQSSLEQSLYNELNTRFKGRLQPHFQRKSSLITLSHILEDQVLNRNFAPVIFTAFQKAKYFQQERPRYKRLGQLARAVTIFGQDLPGGKIFQHEWFIVINEPRFKALVASYELNTGDFEKFFPANTFPLSGENNRLFVGFWSYEPEVVDFATQLLAGQSASDVQRVVAELLAEPPQPEEQFHGISQVSDLILSHLEKSNLQVLDQIKHNQQLLIEIAQQSEQLDLLKRLDRLDDRQKLHQELLALYNETARTHTLLHQTTFKRVQAEQTIQAAQVLLPQVQAEIARLVPLDDASPINDLLAQLTDLLAAPQNPPNS